MVCPSNVRYDNWMIISAVHLDLHLFCAVRWVALSGQGRQWHRRWGIIHSAAPVYWRNFRQKVSEFPRTMKCIIPIGIPHWYTQRTRQTELLLQSNHQYGHTNGLCNIIVCALLSDTLHCDRSAVSIHLSIHTIPGNATTIDTLGTGRSCRAVVEVLQKLWWIRCQ